MPTYDYECKTCDKIFEVFQGINAPKLTECPTCGAPIRRLLGAGSGVIFKGSGFYETDYKTKTGKKTDSISSGETTQKKSADSTVTKQAKKTEKKDIVKK